MFHSALPQTVCARACLSSFLSCFAMSAIEKILMSVLREVYIVTRS